MYTPPVQTATIAASGTVSDVISNRGGTVTGFILPAAFTGTAMSFQVCDSAGGTFVALNDDSGAVSLTVAQGKAYVCPAELAPFPVFKFVSGSAEGAEREITVVRKLQD